MALGLGARGGRAITLKVDGEAQARGTDTVWVLDQAEQSVTFVDVDEVPVPSLLRGFSAPVVLEDDLSAQDRLVLLSHDTDAFNRWEAGQRLLPERMLPAA